jgi:hypothetical protein
MGNKGFLLHLVSPELAPGETGLRHQEHQRSVLYVDITSIFSFCAPTPPHTSLAPRGKPEAPESLALTQSPSLLQAHLRKTLSREALGPSAEEAED